MIVKSKINNEYVGPKAIFDPNYVPPELLYRKKETNSLFSILKDSITDNFSLNILYQGIQGIGKKVIANKVLKELVNYNKYIKPICRINIDCKDKDLEEILISLLIELNKFYSFNLDFNSLLNSKLSHLWNIFKLITKKINEKTFFIINNTESLRPDIYKKFLLYGKESNITLIFTINKILRPSTLDILSEFDLKKKLKYFAFNELLNILKQRVSLTFSHEIDKELLEFITDLIFEHYVPVPGKGIDILREIYPFLKDHKKIQHFEMLEICQNQFDTFQISDELNMLSFISEEDLLTIIFLDNLANYFTSTTKFYITLKKLKELYDISCESIGYEKISAEFKKLIDLLQRIGILSGSKKEFEKVTLLKPKNPNIINSYFLVINPTPLKAIVDAIFRKS